MSVSQVYMTLGSTTVFCSHSTKCAISLAKQFNIYINFLIPVDFYYKLQFNAYYYIL